MERLSPDAREALRAKAYITQMLASIWTKDPEHNEIWDLIPEHIAEQLEVKHAALAAEFIELAERIRAIRQRHHDDFLDRFQG